MGSVGGTKDEVRRAAERRMAETSCPPGDVSHPSVCAIGRGLYRRTVLQTSHFCGWAALGGLVNDFRPLYTLKNGRRWGGARGGVEGGGAHDSRGELFRICRGRKFIRRVHSPCPPPAGERQPGSGRNEMQWGQHGRSIPLLASPLEMGVAKDPIW